MKNQKELMRIGAIALAALVVLRLILSLILGGTIPLLSQPELGSFLLNQGSPAPSTNPLAPSTQITEPSTEATEPSTEITEPSTSPSEPSTNPPEPSTEITEPSTEITEPSTNPPEPSTEPTAPSTEPTKPSTKPTEPSTTPIEPSEPTPPEVHIPTGKPSFSSDDKKYFGVSYSSSVTQRPNLTSLLTQKLEWDLTGSQPTVLIIHTHGTEAYTPTADSMYKEYGGEYRTDDDRYNMISIGDELTRLLEAKGIKVIHDRTPYDKDDYYGAYDKSKAAVKKWLAEYPSIKMVLDLHRDAAENEDGTQWKAVTTVNGEETARLMMVVGASHSNWTQNMSLATKFSVLLNRTYGNMARYITAKYKSYNQNLCPGSLIVEVGAAGNTHQEALNAMGVLAEAIVALSKGTK